MANNFPAFTYSPISMPSGSSVQTALNNASNALTNFKNTKLKEEQLRQQALQRQQNLDLQNRQLLATQEYRDASLQQQKDNANALATYRTNVLNLSNTKYNDTKKTNAAKQKAIDEFGAEYAEPNKYHLISPEAANTTIDNLHLSYPNITDNWSLNEKETKYQNGTYIPKTEQEKINLESSIKYKNKNSTKEAEHYSNMLSDLSKLKVKETDSEKRARIITNLRNKGINLTPKMVNDLLISKNLEAAARLETQKSISADKARLTGKIKALQKISHKNGKFGKLGKTAYLDAKINLGEAVNVPIWPDVIVSLYGGTKDESIINDGADDANSRGIPASYYVAAVKNILIPGKFSKANLSGVWTAKNLADRAEELYKNGKSNNYKIANEYKKEKIKNIQKQIANLNVKEKMLSRGRDYGIAYTATQPISNYLNNINNRRLLNSNQVLPVNKMTNGNNSLKLSPPTNTKTLSPNTKRPAIGYRNGLFSYYD